MICQGVEAALRGAEALSRVSEEQSDRWSFYRQCLRVAGSGRIAFEAAAVALLTYAKRREDSTGQHSLSAVRLLCRTGKGKF